MRSESVDALPVSVPRLWWEAHLHQEMSSWSWSWTFQDNLHLISWTFSSLDSYLLSWKLETLREFCGTWRVGDFVCLTFVSTGDVWERQLSHFDQCVVWGDSCNSCFLWFWCDEDGMPVFWFECLLEKSGETVVDSNDRNSELFPLKWNWWRMDGNNYCWVIYYSFLGEYNFCTTSQQSSTIVW